MKTVRDIIPSLKKASMLILKHESREYLEEHKKLMGGIPTVLKYKFQNSNIIVIGAQHNNYPNSTMINSIKEEVSDYFKMVPKEKRLVIVEGFSEVKPLCRSTFKQSVIEGGEPMGIVFLAKQNSSEVISPEPTDKYTIKILLKENFSKDEISLFFFLRQSIDMIRRRSVIKRRENRYLNHFISQLKENLKISWLDSFDGTDKSLIIIINKINIISRKYLGKNLFKINNYTILPNLTYDEANNQFFAPYSIKFGNSKITNKINAVQDDIRDYMILNEIYRAVKLNKSPLIVYGQSHVIRLKPALDYLYRTPSTKIKNPS